MKKLIAFSAAALVLCGLASTSVLAGPPKKADKKVVEVWHCPMTGEVVKNKDAKGTKFENYDVHFCCGGCPESFAKLSKKDKEAKVKEAVAKDKADAKKG